MRTLATIMAWAGCHPLDAEAPDGPPLGPFAVSDTAAEVVSCRNVHAYLVRQGERLRDCDTPIDGVDSVWAGRGLGDCVDGDAPGCRCDGLTPNECTDHFWANPAVGADPGGGQQLWFLPDTPTTARCAIGTRPAFYFSPGRGAGRSKWVFFLWGESGGYNAMLDRSTGEVRTLGEVVAETAARMVPGESQSGFGYRASQSASGALASRGAHVFRDWNRVELVKCHGDQYTGQRVHRDVRVEDDGHSRVVAEAVYNLGHTYVKQVMSWLGSEPWAEASGHPRLASASDVALMGMSAGAHGLIHTADALREHLAPHVRHEARIGVVIDARPDLTVPALEMFDDTPCPTVFAASCADAELGRGVADYAPLGWSVRFGFDPSSWLPPGDPACDGGPYACGLQRLKWDSWDPQLDESCLRAGGPPTRCYDAQYVLLEHLGTPAFVTLSTRDEVMLRLATNLPAARDQATTCFAAWQGGADAFEHTVRRWVRSYYDHRDAWAAGDARGAGPRGVWATRAVRHTQLRDGCAFAGRALTDPATGATATLSAAIGHWWAGHDVYLVEGDNAVATQAVTGLCADHADDERPLPVTCEVPEYCGDGVVGGHEACDDGNSVDDDGCTNRCLRAGP